MYIYAYIYMYIHVYIHTHTCVCVCVCVPAYARARVCVCKTSKFIIVRNGHTDPFQMFDVAACIYHVLERYVSKISSIQKWMKIRSDWNL